jgi:hypothetical protein
MSRLALFAAAVAVALVACGGDDPDDREQVEEVTNGFFEGLVEGDCDKLSDSLAREGQIPEGQCRDFVRGLEEDFASAVSASFGGTLDEFELSMEDVRAVDIREQDEATATVIVHLNFGADGDLSEVFGVPGADGELSGEVNIPTGFAYIRQDGDWKISEPFQAVQPEE